MTSYRGIDYGMGKTNIDKENGIRYGVIHINRLHEFAWEEFEGIYAPGCPSCGELLDDDFESPANCPHCNELIKDGEQFGDEPGGYEYVGDPTYKLELGDDGDIFVIKSPYYTFAQFCSPCAPGAGHLEHYCEDGPKTYCLGAEWFHGEPPYPIFNVE